MRAHILVRHPPSPIRHDRLPLRLWTARSFKDQSAACCLEVEQDSSPIISYVVVVHLSYSACLESDVASNKNVALYPNY